MINKLWHILIIINENMKTTIILFIMILLFHVIYTELDHKEGWVLKNWCFQTVVLEKTLKSPLDSKIKPVNPKVNQPWIFIGRTSAEAPILCAPDAKSQLFGKDPDSGKEKGAAEDEMVR